MTNTELFQSSSVIMPGFSFVVRNMTLALRHIASWVYCLACRLGPFPIPRYWGNLKKFKDDAMASELGHLGPSPGALSNPKL